MERRNGDLVGRADRVLLECPARTPRGAEPRPIRNKRRASQRSGAGRSAAMKGGGRLRDRHVREERRRDRRDDERRSA